MTNTEPYRYSPPVDRLLTYGDCQPGREWPDYLQLGLTSEHVSELIRMATDEDLHFADTESLEVWAPVHAWRALGQLRAEAAIQPLSALLARTAEDLEDDWTPEELPYVFAEIGPAAIPELTAFLTVERRPPMVYSISRNSIRRHGMKWWQFSYANWSSLMIRKRTSMPS
jgi:hypothetical protein